MSYLQGSQIGTKITTNWDQIASVFAANWHRVLICHLLTKPGHQIYLYLQQIWHRVLICHLLRKPGHQICQFCHRCANLPPYWVAQSAISGSQRNTISKGGRRERRVGKQYRLAGDMYII